MNNGFQVFLAHASENKNDVRQLKNSLSSEGITTWFDEDDLPGGVKWREEIPEAIKTSAIFIACISKEAVGKTGYIQKELRHALITYSERPPGEIYLIPLKLDDCDIPALQIPELGIDLRDFQYIDLKKNGGFEKLIKTIKTAFEKKKKEPDKLIQPRFKKEQWQKLEKSVRDIAAIAGFAAMGYYRNALAETGEVTSTANPSTIADENATLAILQTLSSFESLADDLGYNYRVFAEELDTEETASRILHSLKGNTIYSKIKTSTTEFRKDWDRSISILVDAIDGTTNFDACLPFYCSAVAIFIGGHLSVGAIYDPFHNQVFYGSLRTLEDGQVEPVAKVWNIHAGNIDDYSGRGHTVSKRKLISTHITRSDEDARNRFLHFIPKLYENKMLQGGTYMLNCGQMALANVACGNIAAFINNTTGIWDVAAGEVLIRATGGKITDFKGRDIDYGKSSRVSVIACESDEIYSNIKRQIDEHYPWEE